MTSVIVLVNDSVDLNVGSDVQAILSISEKAFIIDIDYETKDSLCTTLNDLVYKEHTMLFYTGHGHKDDIIRNKRGIEFNIKDIINAIPCHTLYSILDCCNIENTNLNYMYYKDDSNISSDLGSYYWKLIKFPINTCYNKKVLIISTRQPYNHQDHGSYLTLYIVSLIRYSIDNNQGNNNIIAVKLNSILNYNDYGRNNIILHTNDITLSSMSII